MVFGPVRNAAIDAANTAKVEAQKTADVARKSMLQLTEKGLVLLGKMCEVADEVIDGGSLELWALGKKIGELKVTLKEKGDKQ